MEPVESLDKRIRECRAELARVQQELRHLDGLIEGLRNAQSIVGEDTARITYDVDGALAEIDKKISATKARNLKIKQDIDRLQGELEGLRIARELLAGDENEVRVVEDDEGSYRREISPAWKKILAFFLQRSPGSLTIDEVMHFIAQNELRISRNAVRSQLHLYVQRGFLKRMGDGHYKATDAVKRVC